MGALLLFLAGCSSQGRRIEITATDYRFSPAQVSVQPGERVTFVVTNRGKVEHRFEGEGIPAVMVEAGQTRQVAWTAPMRKGTVEFWCNLPGHLQAGMVGQVRVE